MFLVRILLFPFAVLYNGISRLRNLLYDLGIQPSASFDIPTISVGNLAVGGTGKTPMVEHLIRLLQAKHFSVATLSRGYGRTTKGMRLANSTDSASSLGDEPFQLFQKFKDKAVVSVCEERAVAIPFLVDQYPDLQAIVLDDAFQHRAVNPGFSMVLTEYSSPFYHDFLMPSGRLREARTGAARADLIIVTKCPAPIDEDEMMGMEHEIRKYAQRPVFFTKIRYGNPVCFSGKVEMDKKIVLVSGLANARPLEEYASANFTLVRHFNFRDHHAYTKGEVQKILTFAQQQAATILTTEKDWSKIDLLLSEEERSHFYFLPIEIEFIKNGSDFDALVLDYVQKAQPSLID
jgi:tetraacyldisaccharide 4'-kinase